MKAAARKPRTGLWLWLALLLALAAGLHYMTHMPGSSHAGPRPPLSGAQAELRDRLGRLHRKESESIVQAIHNFFEYQTEVADRELRQGRASLVIGLLFLCSPASARGRWSPRSATACSMISSRRGCSSAAGWRCGGRSRYFSTTGGRFAIGASSVTS